MRSLYLLFALCLSCAAASKNYPPIEQVTQSVSGAQIEAYKEPKKSPPINGELLALDERCLYIGQEDGITSISTTLLNKALVKKYSAKNSVHQWAVASGTLTVLSAYAMFITLPAWVIANLTTRAIDKRKTTIKFPRDPLSELKPYARFPQGLPPAFAAKYGVDGDCPTEQRFAIQPTSQPTSTPASQATSAPASQPASTPVGPPKPKTF